MSAIPTAFDPLGAADGLPAGYVGVRMLVSDGKQFIATGLAYNEDYTVRFVFRWLGTIGSRGFYGYTSGSARHYLYLSGTPPFWQAGLGTQFPNMQLADTEKHEVVFTGVKCYLDGVLRATGSHTSYAYGPSFLGAYSGTASNVPLEIYSYTVQNAQNETIVDMVPCRDKLGRPCMYDRARKRAYYNSGTGEFETL